MPSFDVLLLSAPLGFVDSCLLINQFSETKENELQLIIKEVWDLELKKIIESQTTSLSQESPETIKKIKRVITFIIQSMKQAQPTPSISITANVLASKSFLTKECIEKILLTIKEVSSQAANEEISPLEIAKVIILSFILVILNLPKHPLSLFRHMVNYLIFNGKLVYLLVLAIASNCFILMSQYLTMWCMMMVAKSLILVNYQSTNSR